MAASRDNSASSHAPFKRIPYARIGHSADANIRCRYPAERASWIWHPARLNETAFLRFTLPFDLEAEMQIALQVSADQRFQLSLDGNEFAYGPDRSDIAHWSLQTYEGRLGAGPHVLSALVWWIADAAYGVPYTGNETNVPIPPMAQCSFRGGFLLSVIDEPPYRFDTGEAPWQVEDLTHAVRLEKRSIFHDIGPSFVIDAHGWKHPKTAKTPIVIRNPIENSVHGIAQPGWRLDPSPLPEQQRTHFHGGNIREVRRGSLSLRAWQDLVAQQIPLAIAPNSQHDIILDIGEYLCGYPQLGVSQGENASITISWAEALYEAASENDISASTQKGDRNKTSGKAFFGFSDTFICSGENLFRFPSFWWRAGRYIRIQIETEHAPLIIESLALKTTHYPLDWEGHVECDDPSLLSIARLAANTMRQGTHELFTDSPYYEQMAYVGDNITEALVSYVMTNAPHMPRRAIELFDWSRTVTGLVAERYPSTRYQGSTTYAMLWPSMVRNHAWWRGEPDFISACLHSVRQLIEVLTLYLDNDGLLGPLPGWSFADWVPDAWPVGMPPCHETGDSSIIQFHWVHCLQAAADLEKHFGDPELHARLLRMEHRARISILERYYCTETDLFYDEGKHLHLSEHANALATLLGFRLKSAQHWPEELERHPHARCSVYFSHYLLEAFYKERRADLFFKRLEFWRDLPVKGFLTIPERPEPTRSDCHAWGAHPLYHIYSSIAGIRPSSPGFKTVSVRPMLGPLKHISGSFPHPEGKIDFTFETANMQRQATIVLPEGIKGVFESKENCQQLVPGPNPVNFYDFDLNI